MIKIQEIAGKWWFWIGLAFLLYANTLNHEYVIDDQIVVTNNSLTKEGISALPEIFKHSYLYGYDGREDESYRPLTLTTFAIERSMFDANPAASHFIQVLLYGLCVLVLFRFLNSFFEGKIHSKWIFIITALFALHPIHTEVVANVKSRDELLCALLLFTSLNYFVKYLKTTTAGKGSVITILLSIVSYFLATLSKETAVPAIVLFPIIVWFISDKKGFFSAAMMLVPAGLYLVIRSSVLSNVLIKDAIDPVANSLALANSTAELLASNFSIFSKYLQLIFFPWNLSWDYSVSQLPISSFGSISSIFGLVAVLAILLCAILGVVRKNIAGFGAVLFLATFIATSNFFFLINCPLGERFMFIPLLGIILIIVFALQYLVSRFPQLKPAGLYLSIAIFGFFSVRTVLRNVEWKSNLSIYEAGVKVSPKSVKTHFNLGTEHITQGNLSTNAESKRMHFESALSSLNTAISIYPKYANIYENKSYALAELAKLTGSDSTYRKRYLEEAKATIDTAIYSLRLEKPTLIQNQYYNINELIKLETDSLVRTGYLEDLNQLAHQQDEWSQNDYHNAFYALSSLGRKDELIEMVEGHAADFPDLIALTSEEALKYFNDKDYSRAIRLLSVYLNVIPRDFGMKTNLGMMYELSGDKKRAKEIYSEVLKEDPSNAKAQSLLGNLR